MRLIKSLKLSDKQMEILDSVLPGGEGWEVWVKSVKEPCLDSCPYLARCGGNGPGAICSDDWRDADFNTDVAEVVSHVLRNFDHYNQSDVREKTQKDIARLRSVVEKAHSGLPTTTSEGKKRLKMHYVRERDSDAARNLKRQAYKSGKLKCEACGVDYLKKYGRDALSIIECHHNIPLSSPRHRGKTEIKDLRLLCANCHRLAHSTKSPLSVDRLIKLVRKVNKRRV